MKYSVFADAWEGLRRNKSIAVSVILVTMISMYLLGVGLLAQQQVNQMKGYWYDRVQVSVYMCTETSAQPNCATGAASKDQRASVEAQLGDAGALFGPKRRAGLVVERRLDRLGVVGNQAVDGPGQLVGQAKTHRVDIEAERPVVGHERRGGDNAQRCLRRRSPRHGRVGPGIGERSAEQAEAQPHTDHDAPPRAGHQAAPRSRVPSWSPITVSGRRRRSKPSLAYSSSAAALDCWVLTKATPARCDLAQASPSTVSARPRPTP